MYRLAVSREFEGRHIHLAPSGDEETAEHTHQYRLEILLSGRNLDGRGYLADILEIERILDALARRFSEGPINTLPELKGINPSVENFSRIARAAFVEEAKLPEGIEVEARVWESSIAWASYSGSNRCDTAL